jgi:hypothetical protein
MELLIIAVTIGVLSAVITLVMITHRRQCREIRMVADRLERSHWSTSVSDGGQSEAAA